MHFLGDNVREGKMRLRDAAADFIGGLTNWRVWVLMGANTLRQRYSRSVLGQWWIVLGTIIANTAFGVLWSQLWKLPVSTFLPYVAIGHVCWALLAGPLTDSISALPASAYYYVNQKASFTTVFLAGYFRNLLVFAHNAIIIPVLWVSFGTPISYGVLFFLPAVLLVAVCTVNLSIIIGLVSCRYRDLGQVIGNALQVLYMITPVMWIASYLKPETTWIVEWNPFAQMLFLLRNPLIGETTTLHAWVCCTAFAVVSAAVMLVTLSIMGRRVVYWM